MSDETLDILKNREAIAINQDPAVIPAQRIRTSDEVELWRRELADGSLCVVLLQKTEAPRAVSFTWEEIGLQLDASVVIRDLWEHKTLGTFTGRFAIQVNAHGCAMLKVTK